MLSLVKIGDAMLDRYLSISLGLVGRPQPIAAIREAYRREGIECAAFGDSDSKTGLPGFYRPVGVVHGTCPHDCYLLPASQEEAYPCYAHGGRVVLIAKRSPISVEAAVASFVACSVVAMVRDKHPSRMFISGDGCRNGRVDNDLFEALFRAADAVAAELGVDGPVAYGYTQIKVESSTIQWEARKHHLTLLRSRYPGPGGAVVWPITHLQELREMFPEVKFKPCLHYLEGLRCRQCSLCHKAVDRGHCVVLQPVGNNRRRLKQTLLLLGRRAFTIRKLATVGREGL